MKLILALLAAIFVSCASTGGEVIRDGKLVKSEDISIKLQPQNNTISDDSAVVTVTNKKTGKTWTFSHKEFQLIINSWENWKLVSNIDPEISQLRFDNKYVYITFNYYRRSDDGRTKTSVLSGIIKINRDYISDDTTKGIYKATTIGLGAYSMLVTILVIILTL